MSQGIGIFIAVFGIFLVLILVSKVDKKEQKSRSDMTESLKRYLGNRVTRLDSNGFGYRWGERLFDFRIIREHKGSRSQHTAYVPSLEARFFSKIGAVESNIYSFNVMGLLRGISNAASDFFSFKKRFVVKTSGSTRRYLIFSQEAGWWKHQQFSPDIQLHLDFLLKEFGRVCVSDKKVLVRRMLPTTISQQEFERATVALDQVAWYIEEKAT